MRKVGYGARGKMSGVGFLAAVKTFTPSARRRRRSEKQLQRLELPGTESSVGQQAPQPDVVPAWDTAPPITPPAAFLPANHKKNKPSSAVVVASGKVGRNAGCPFFIRHSVRK